MDLSTGAVAMRGEADVARFWGSRSRTSRGADGVRLGRATFANTLKYVRVTTSANFGNMLSMAAAAAFLLFLPLLPRQILLLNFLSDIFGTTIAADTVDPEQLQSPQAWDITAIRRFMIAFGLISSAFDIATFVILRAGFDTGTDLFRSSWFLESTATELAVMLVLAPAARSGAADPAQRYSPPAHSSPPSPSHCPTRPSPTHSASSPSRAASSSRSPR